MRVILVDDHAAFRESLAFMLDREPDITIVADVGTVAEARKHLEDIDIGVVDLHLADGKGTDVVRALRMANPRCSILVVTGSRVRQEIAEAVEAGADAVMHLSLIHI